MFSLKRHLPKSLFGRALAIIIVPIAIMQIVVAYIFFEAHWQTVTARLSDGVAADIAVTTQLYTQDPGEARAQRLNAMIQPGMLLSVQLNDGEILPTATRKAFFSSLDRTLRRALGDALGETPFWFDTTRYPNHIDIRVQVEDGVLRYIAPRERVFASTGFIFIFWMAMATAFLSLVSILFILNQARPIVRLAEAADAFGKGQDIGKFKPSGATEVRQASQSFLDMRDRIMRHLDQRTTLLAGVSHDLRTPLTRLKLQMAMSDETEDTLAARRDISDMEVMLDGYLDFARGLGGEDVDSVDIVQLLTQILESYPTPKPELIIDPSVRRSGAYDPLTLTVRRGAIKRAIVNIVENARSHAETVTLTLRKAPDETKINDSITAPKTEDEVTARYIEILVDDNGPGIASDDRERAFQPFVRLDAARSQNVKGVGLGLSIARDAARAHGGDLTLSDGPDGGLRCIFRLPV